MWDFEKLTEEGIKNNAAFAELEAKRKQYDEEFDRSMREEQDGEHDSYLIDRDNANEINIFNIWG